MMVPQGLDKALAHTFDPEEHGLRKDFVLTDFSKVRGVVSALSRALLCKQPA
jgi:hypothetical protein